MIKVSIYGLRRCTNNECRITWDRDHNARINIYNCMESEINNGTRPAYLEHQQKKKVLLIKKKLTQKPMEET